MENAYESFRVLFDLLNPPGPNPEPMDQPGFLASVKHVQGEGLARSMWTTSFCFCLPVA